MKKLLFAFPIVALLAAGCNSQPQQQSNQQNQNTQQQQESNQNNLQDIAVQVRDYCIETVKNNTGNDVSLSDTADNPLFNHGYDETAFNQDVSLMTSLIAFSSCLDNDPRNDGHNSYLSKISSDASTAKTTIGNFLASVKEGNPSICSSPLLNSLSTQVCNSFTETWTGETFLGGVNGKLAPDPNNFPKFSNKQDCLNWGNSQKAIDKTDSFSCGENCGTVTSSNTAKYGSYFICEEDDAIQ